MEKVKLIWDFHGPDADPIAAHHVKHLVEYINAHAIAEATAAKELIDEEHVIAAIICPKESMIQIRDALRPQRGEQVDS